jgi:PAS domain S-box-containing protein
MTSATFTGLINNTALLITLALIYDVVILRQPGQKTSLNQIPLGITLGIIGIGIMMNPWEFLPGVIFDTRSVLLSVTGLFFGTVPTLGAVLITGGYRLSIGGTGAWTGFAVIVTSGAVGLAWRHWVKKDLETISIRDLYLMSIVTHVLMLLWMLTLPRSIAFGVLSKISLPVILIFPLGTLLIGKLMINRKERIKAVEKIQEGEKKYRQLFHSINDAIFVHLIGEDGLPGRFIEVNDIACERLGYTMENLLQLTPGEIGLSESKTNSDTIIDTLKEHGSHLFETIHVTKDRQQIPVESHLRLFESNGKQAVLSISRDITDRKQAQEELRESEEHYRAVVNNIGDYIMRYDRDFKHIYANRNAIEATGLPVEEYIGKDHREMGFPENLCELWENNIQLVFDTGEQQNVAFDVELEEGPISVELQLNPEFGADEKVKSVLGISRDVTERKNMETRLQHVQKMDTIGTLAGGIAHDFNNILFPILGHTEMLLEDVPEDSPLRGSLDEIYTGSLRARDLVKQILTFSRQDSNEIKLMKLQPVIKEALKLIRSTIPAGISIKQYIQSEPLITKADPTQIHQIVMNLATNAYHAMEDTGGVLTVNLKQIELDEQDVMNLDMEPGTYACLTVADTGVGMDKDLTEKIFDPFFTTKENGKGTGLGLSVVHGIVNNIGGSIHVYSEPGKETEFHVYLPVVKSAVAKKEIQTTELIQRGTEQILLVDDEEPIASMEKQMLERLGYQVVSRTSSVEALEAFKANPDKFDLVITDMAMPNMSGDQLASELIKIRPDIPIVLCTGFSERMPEEQAESMGIKGFLMKPIIMKDLSKKIREVLDKS